MKYLLIIPAVLLALLLTALIRTFLTPKKTSSYKACENETEALTLAEKLSSMI